MKAQILSTGDEVLLGDIVDTNSAYLCSAAKEMGIEVKKISAVGDDPEEIAAVLSEISGKAQICFVTGGLGPTQDDLTAAACSQAAGDELILHPDALASMKRFFEKKGFSLNRENEKQAMLPSKSGVLENHNGTAPGFYICMNQCWFFFMPGVPSEMKQMFERQLKQILSEKFNLGSDILIERLTVFGLPESTVGAKLQGFETEFPMMRLGFRAKFPLIEVKILCPCNFADEDAARAVVLNAKEWSMKRLGNRVISKNGFSIEQEIGRFLADQDRTLAVAESCTGGLISNMVTNVAGSSDYFLLSAVTYSNEAKMAVLGVREKTLFRHGAVHEQTAIEMAEGVRKKAGADFAISTTGIAGPGGGTVEKPVGRVCIGLSWEGGTSARAYTLDYGERLRNKQMFAAMALELLRRHLASSAKAG